jgi:aspartate carbamoyltransferase catalytic subunit
MQHILRLDELSDTEILQLIERAQAFKAGTSVELKRPVYASNLFFEASTRTHRSFEMAQHRLGVKVLDFDVEHSSVLKGESLYDSVLTLQALGVELMVIRHPEEAFYAPLIASKTITASLINGGDGRGHHPSQSLLDLMTMVEEFGTLKGLKVRIVGDLKNSRVAHSNAEVFKRFGATLSFSGPDHYQDPGLQAYGVYQPLDEGLETLDVLMMLRVQHERHSAGARFDAKAYHQQYGLSEARYARLKPSAIVMHPAPINRGVEISDALVEAPQSRIVAQMENGVYVRMAMCEALIRARGENA